MAMLIARKGASGFLGRYPRIALALSEDLFRWKRIGLATFEPYDGLDFNGVGSSSGEGHAG